MTSIKVMVVEDENIVAIDIKNSLNKLGYDVVAVTDSGENAIKEVTISNPELVIMDIKLQGRIDGVTAAKIIRQKFQLPVIYLTAYSDEVTLQRAKKSEPFGYILKPFDAKDLQIAIEIALDKHKIERHLQNRVGRLDTILKSIGDGVVVTDSNGCIQFMNPVAEALTGWKQKDAFEKKLVEVLYLIDKDIGETAFNPAKQLIRDGVVLNLPNSGTLIAKDGTERFIENSAAPIRDRQNNITGVVLTLQDITERKRVEENLLRSAMYDSLTQLPNRVLLLERLKQAIERVKRRNENKFAVLFLDLDGFKAVNDRFGHAIGDQMLVAIARRLETCIRAVDTLARLGGDEFVVLLEDIHKVNDAIRVADRIQAALGLPLNLNGQEIFATVSIGIALSTTSDNQPENLLREADTAMYRAKILGKARYTIFNSSYT